MAGFEIVVRPVVFPNIRPTPNPSALPPDDPTKGLCVIEGSAGQWVEFSDSWSVSSSKSKPVETERRFDVARVYQQNDDGTVNKDNFVDVEVPTKITARGGKGPASSTTPADPNVPASKGDSEEISSYYARQLEALNIEIIDVDQTRKNKDAK